MSHSPAPWTLEVGDSSHRFVLITAENERTVFYKYASGTAAQADQDEEDAKLAAAAPDLLKLAGQAWGALNFILAFYEPGQRYLDTEAWKQAEAGGRRVHAALREKLDALPEAPK